MNAAGPAPDPGPVLHLARRLLADARAGIEQSPDPGLLLDLATAELAFGAEPHRAAGALARAVDLLGDRTPPPWLYRGGAAQFGWVTTQVEAATGRTPPHRARWDERVAAVLSTFPDDRDVDLPLGLLGLGVHALAHPDEGTRERLVSAVLDVVDDRVEHDVDGILVRTVDAPHRRAEGSAGLTLLGPAHGMAGLVSFLGSAAAAGLACSARTQPLLAGCVRWLLRQRVAPGRWASTGYEPHRLSWCYGDPGIALALCVAAGSTRSSAMARATAEIVDGVLTRPVAESGVQDATICHGAAGLVWFASRTAAHGHARGTGTWIDRIAAERRDGPIRYGPARARDHSFLEGDLGVAVALLHAATGSRAAWEQLLLGTVVRPPRRSSAPAGTVGVI